LKAVAGSQLSVLLQNRRLCAVRALSARARCPRDSRQDAGATPAIRRHYGGTRDWEL